MHALERGIGYNTPKCRLGYYSNQFNINVRLVDYKNL